MADSQAGRPPDRSESSPDPSEESLIALLPEIEDITATSNAAISSSMDEATSESLITTPGRTRGRRLLRREAPRRYRVWAAVMGEAVAGLTQKVSRTVLTMVGTAIGAGAIVAILGLTATAAGQIDESFNELQATQVIVNDSGPLSPGGFVDSFPSDAVPRVSGLNGVEFCGMIAMTPRGSGMVTTPATSATTQLPLSVYGATADYFAALGASWGLGGPYTQFEQAQGLPVVVVGAEAAAKSERFRWDQLSSSTDSNMRL